MISRLSLTTMATHIPKISIVTPSFNQAEFLEQTLRSVLDQNYPNLEYLVIDGASTDDSAEIIKTYAKHLTYGSAKKTPARHRQSTKGWKEQQAIFWVT